MRPLALLSVATVLFAGCSDDGGKKDEFEDVFEETEVATGKGLIRGIVLDPALTPVSGALVALAGTSLTKTTTEAGAFVFTDLDPGTYFITVSRPGWTQVQQSADVAADVDEPAIVKVIVERLPGAEPRAFTLDAEGYLSCSIGTPRTIHDCSTLEEQRTTLWFPIDGLPHWIQTEVTWDSTQPVGDWFYIIQGICACDGEPPSLQDPRFNETPEARSPYIVRIPDADTGKDWLAENDAGTDNAELAIDVSASGPEPQTTNGSGVAVNQAFHGYVTFFYNFDPDPAWTFIEDGNYPVPSGN